MCRHLRTCSGAGAVLMYSADSSKELGGAAGDVDDWWQRG